MATYTSIFAQAFRRAVRFVGIGIAPSATTADASVPTITSGSGVPTATEQAGSLYMRTNGSLYTTTGGGSWATAAAGADFGATGLLTDVVAESTAANGVTVDGVKLKDGGVTQGIGASTAAAGTTTADAGVLPAATAGVYPTTAADGTKGVRIHADDKVTGRTLWIGNGVSNQILKVYAPSGGAINGASADAAFSSASGKGVLIVCLSSAGNTWFAW